MGVFQDAYNKIAAALDDALNLDVVTFKGTIQTAITDVEKPPTKIEEVLKAAKTNGTVTLLASTKMSIDGDVLVYFDEKITADEAKAHAALVEVGQKAREATFNFILNVVGVKKDPASAELPKPQS